jgi:hypothetical protein
MRKRCDAIVLNNPPPTPNARIRTVRIYARTVPHGADPCGASIYGNSYVLCDTTNNTEVAQRKHHPPSCPALPMRLPI